jgi:hypothetical protein
MARLDPHEFGDHELVRVYMATTVREARLVEALLTERGVNYVVQPEPFGRTFLGSSRIGAAIYVATAHADYCAVQLVTAGFRRVLIETSLDDR